jgi:hypothetical protein
MGKSRVGKCRWGSGTFRGGNVAGGNDPWVNVASRLAADDVGRKIRSLAIASRSGKFGITDY